MKTIGITVRSKSLRAPHFLIYHLTKSTKTFWFK